MDQCDNFAKRLGYLKELTMDSNAKAMIFWRRQGEISDQSRDQPQSQIGKGINPNDILSYIKKRIRIQCWIPFSAPSSAENADKITSMMEKGALGARAFTADALSLAGCDTK